MSRYILRAMYLKKRTTYNFKKKNIILLNIKASKNLSPSSIGPLIDPHSHHFFLCNSLRSFLPALLVRYAKAKLSKHIK